MYTYFSSSTTRRWTKTSNVTKSCPKTATAVISFKMLSSKWPIKSHKYLADFWKKIFHTTTIKKSHNLVTLLPTINISVSHLHKSLTDIFFRWTSRRTCCSARPLRDEHAGGAHPDDEGLPTWTEWFRERSQLALARRKQTLTHFYHCIVKLSFNMLLTVFECSILLYLASLPNAIVSPPYLSKWILELFLLI